MRIGELAKASRVNIETIRFYEREALLPKPKRTPSGYRDFHPETAKRVLFIKGAQDLGFSLKEIRQLIRIQDKPGDCGDVRAFAQAKVRDIDAKIKSLIALRNTLHQVTLSCPGKGPLAHCSIIESIQSNGKEVKS